MAKPKDGALVAGGRGGHKVERLAQREEQSRPVFERRLGMAHQQMHSDNAGADDRSGQRTTKTALA